ncbi:MAG: TrmH family RNA methyltransferase [Bacteroidia bacterium]
MTVSEKESLLKFFTQFITEERNKRLDDVIVNRTRHFTVVLEDIYQSQNASAVLRSCDCFGIQDVHIIENKNKYKLNPDVELGSSKWLNMNKYNWNANNTLECIDTLKKKGYRIIATTPHFKSVPLEELKIDTPFALMFGTEIDGLSDIALQNADEFVKIPMVGFTESLNISVSAAICMHHLNLKLRQSDIDWKLSDEEILEIKIDWLRAIISRSDVLEREYLKKQV